jgi:hypothetical protein
MSDNTDNIYTEIGVLMSFIQSNRDKLTEIYEMEHTLNGSSNPDNNGNPGALVVNRKPDNQVDIFYYQWSQMEDTLKSSVIEASQKSPNQFNLILIDNICNKSVMVGMEKSGGGPMN